METAEHAGARATFSTVFAVSEFRALWGAQVLSVVGDQLARVALTLLVYDRTRSPLLAAITFAASVLPVCVGGILLAGLADRFPRRQLMIACDLARMVLVTVMITPRLPVAVLIVMLFAVTMLGPPFSSARTGIYADVLAGDGYVVGNAITLTTYQLAQVVGFAAGGALVALVQVRTALVADATTFACSALITAAWVRGRPAAQNGRHRTATQGRDIAKAVSLVFRDPGLRTPMLFGWLAAFYYLPEGVAGPLARSLGGGPSSVGFLLAAIALGAAVGGVAFARLAGPQARLKWMRPLAIAACGALTLFALGPPLPLALVFLLVSGLCDCFQVAASAAFIAAAPPEQRSQVFGIALAGMSLVQGMAMILAGAAVAETLAPATVIASSGAIGAVVATLIPGRPTKRSQPDGC